MAEIAANETSGVYSVTGSYIAFFHLVSEQTKQTVSSVDYSAVEQLRSMFLYLIDMIKSGDKVF